MKDAGHGVCANCPHCIDRCGLMDALWPHRFHCALLIMNYVNGVIVPRVEISTYCRVSAANNDKLELASITEKQRPVPALACSSHHCISGRTERRIGSGERLSKIPLPPTQLHGIYWYEHAYAVAHSMCLPHIFDFISTVPFPIIILRHFIYI